MNRPLNICTLGETGHGKTTLMAAISQVLYGKRQCQVRYDYDQIENPPEKLDGGVPIAKTSLEYNTATRQYLQIDCPRYLDFVKNLFAGEKKQMDAGILVLSTQEMISETTHEQLALYHQVGVQNIVVFLNKCDLVEDEERIELIEYELRDILSNHKFPGDEIPIIRGSALHALGVYPEKQWEDKIIELVQALDNYLPEPSVQPSPTTAYTKFEAEVYMLSKEEGGRHYPFSPGYYSQFYFHGLETNDSMLLPEDIPETNGRVLLPEGAVQMVLPGEQRRIFVELIAPIAMEKGLRFAIREGGRPVGVGAVSKII